MIRKCSGQCGYQETVQPYKDGRTLEFRCQACKAADARERTKRYRQVLVSERVVTRTMVIYEG